MTKPNEYYAYFTIAGDGLDPGEISKRLGCLPTHSWRMGEVNPSTSLERKTGRWQLRSRLDVAQDIEAHVVDVLDQMECNAEAFNEVSREFGGYIQIVGYFYTDFPGCHFDRRIVSTLDGFGLEVDFDFYYLYSDSREDS
jgi:hypothetical protein